MPHLPLPLCWLTSACGAPKRTIEPLCVDEDAEYELHVEVDGPGKGGYTFGVWTRPR